MAPSSGLLELGRPTRPWLSFRYKLQFNMRWMLFSSVVSPSGPFHRRVCSLRHGFSVHGESCGAPSNRANFYFSTGQLLSGAILLAELLKNSSTCCIFRITNFSCASSQQHGLPLALIPRPKRRRRPPTRIKPCRPCVPLCSLCHQYGRFDVAQRLLSHDEDSGTELTFLSSD